VKEKKNKAVIAKKQLIVRMMTISESKMAMSLTKKAMQQVESMALDMARQAITECAEVYGFSAEEAIERLGANQVSVRAESKPTMKKTKMEKAAKATFPLPFSGVVRTDCCQGVKPNRGLYSQCEKECVDDGEFCKGCTKQATKNASGEPDYGIITKRGSPDWRDPKGKAPLAFIKVMKKLKLSEEEVLNEVSRLNVAFDASIHFAEEPVKESKRGRPKKAITSDTESEKSEKKRGRPKKAAKVVEITPTEDLFATLVEDAKAAGEMKADMSDLSGSDSESESSSKKSPAEKAAAEAAKAAAKAEKEAQKAAAKAEKEAQKAAEKAEKEAQKAAEKAEKDAQKAAEKAQKESEALAKKAAKDAAKKPKAKVTKKTAEVKAPAVEEPELVSEDESDDDEPAVAVSKFEFKGKMYLKSSNGVIYDRDTQDEIGVWNEAKQDIELCEYESDDE